MVGINPTARPEIDYSPREYTRGETFLHGVKMLAVIGIILILFWLVEKYSFQLI